MDNEIMSKEERNKASLEKMLASVDENRDSISEALAGAFAPRKVATPKPATSVLDELPLEIAIAKDTPAAPAPTPTPSINLDHPAAPKSDELPTPATKRPLVHFGQAQPATKSKANRKLVLQLTPEMYQYLAHVSTLPGLDGVPLPDLAVAILQAWREDYRPEIKKANAAFKA